MKTALAAAAAGALVATAGSVSAQDWGGFYAGGYAGYSMTQDDGDETLTFDTNLDGTYGDTVNTTAPANAFSPGFCAGGPQGPSVATGCSEDESDTGEVGARVGYDMQFGSLVVGVVGDFGTGGGEDAVTGFSTTPANYSFDRQLEYLTAARVRLGFATGRFLPYVTGGYANGRVESTFTTSNAANSFTPKKAFYNVDGYQLGAGVETRIWDDRVSLGLEYMYTSLEDDEFHTVRVGPGVAPATNPFLLVNTSGTDMRRTSDEIEQHAVRVTMAYRF